MAEIKIESAPKEYQKYLKIGDINKNGVIEDDDEAKASAESLCKETSTADCQKFLEYLEKSDYSFPQLKEKLLAESTLKDLEDKEPGIRNIAAGQIKNFAKTNIPDELKGKIAEALIKLLADKDEKVRATSLNSLAIFLEQDLPITVKSKAVDPLLKLLEEKKSEMTVLEALANLVEANIPVEQKTKLILPCLKLLEDPNEEIQAVASGVLLKLSSTSISTENKEKLVEPLLKKISSAHKDISSNALTALSNLSTSAIRLESKTRLIDPMIQALSHDDKDIKKAAAQALVEMAQLKFNPETKARFINPLIKILTDFADSLGTVAKKTLLKIIGSIFGIGSSYDLKLKNLDSLLKLFKYKDDELRAEAFKSLLSILKSNPPVEIKTKIIIAFLKSLKDGGPKIKSLVLQALPDLIKSNLPLEIKGQAFAHLLSILEDTDSGQKKLVLKSLGLLTASGIGKEQKIKLVSPLLKCLEDQDEEIRKIAAAALARLAKSDLPIAEKEKMVDPLITGIKDGNPEVKKAVAKALWYLSSSNLSKDSKFKLIDNFGQKFKIGNRQITVINFSLFDPDKSKNPISFENMIRKEFMEKYQLKDVEAALKLSTHFYDIAKKMDINEINNLTPREAIVFAAKITKLLTYGDKPGRKYQDSSTSGRAKSIAETIREGFGVCHDHAELFLFIFNFLKRTNKNLDNVYAKYIGGRVAGYGMGHAWVMLMEARGADEFMVSYIDPTWAHDDEDSLNAVDRTHFHIGIKIDMHALFTDKKQAKILGRQLAEEYLANNKDSDQSHILNEIAYIYREIINNKNLAIKYYRLAIEKYAASKDDEEGSNKALLEALYYLGHTYFDSKKNNEALEIFARFIKEFPSNFDAPYILDKMAEIYLRQKQYQKAIETYLKIIADDPNHIMADDAYYALGSIYQRYRITGDRTEDLNKACAFFWEGAQKYPNGDRIDDLRKKIKSLRCSKPKITESSTQPASGPDPGAATGGDDD